MTTYERLLQDPEYKSEFDKEYNDFLISEFMIEKMEEEQITVRELAKKSKCFSNNNPAFKKWQSKIC